MPDITAVTIHVDPSCPWAWLTSRWLVEVEKVRPVRVTTGLFSLGQINRDKEADERTRHAHEASEAAMRVLIAARRQGGDPALARLYSEIGEAHQERAEALDDIAVLRACAVAANLDAGLVDSGLGDPSTLTELLDEHGEAVARGAFGVPTLTVGDGPAVFGPCLDTRISGEAAGELWDRVAWLAGAEHFFELKRGRSRAEVGRYLVAAAR